MKRPSAWKIDNYVYRECPHPDREYGYAVTEVARMFAEGSISLGAPAMKDGERLVLVDDGLRYAREFKHDLHRI